MTPSAPETADVILGTAHRMRFEAIEPFLTSLRATGSRARVCLFASRLDPATLIELQRNEVEVVCFRSPLVRMRNPFAYAWPLLKHLSSPGRPEPLRTAVGRLALNLMDVRFLLYRDYVRGNLGRLGRVLLSDIRDVWFQSDPFATPLPAGISTFLEDPSIPIRESTLNAAWIARAFGPAMIGEIGDRVVSCAGVTIGDAAAMLGYVETMCDRLLRVRQLHPVGGEDQGIHNWIAWTPQPFPVTRFANFEGPVLTMGCMARSAIRLNAAGQVIGPDEHPVPVLHQYDRHLDREGLRLVLRA